MAENIKTARIPVAPALNLYRKKLKIICLIMLAVGAVGIVLYLVLGTVFADDSGEAPVWVNSFLILAVPFTLGLIGFIVIIRLHKREVAEGREAEMVFYADCFVYSSKSLKELSETTQRFAYSDAALKCENEKFCYIFVNSKGLFLVFSKEGLHEEQLNAIRKNFNKPTCGGAAELQNYPNNENK